MAPGCFLPNRIGARSTGRCPGACTVLSAKVYYVTNLICFGKSSNIPRRLGYTLYAASQTHTRLSASAPLCPSGQWPSGATKSPSHPRISLIWPPIYSPPFFDGQRPAPGPEPDISLSTIEERYRSVNGGQVGGILGLLTPWTPRLQTEVGLVSRSTPSQEPKGLGYNESIYACSHAFWRLAHSHFSPHISVSPSRLSRLARFCLDPAVRPI